MDSGSTEVAVARRDLGLSLTRLGRYREAEELLLASYPVIRARWGDDHFATRRVRDGVADLGRRQGRSIAMP